MKYMNILGLFAVATAAVMVFAGSASATLTSPAGTSYGGEIVATSSNFQIDGTVNNPCKHTTVRGVPEGGAGSKTIHLIQTTWDKCEHKYSTVDLGHLFMESNGTVKSTGARYTVQTTILGFPVHCIYATNNTTVGTLTEGVAPAQIHIGSSPIPQEATSGACGNDAVWTGTLTITTPTTAIVVD